MQRQRGGRHTAAQFNASPINVRIAWFGKKGSQRLRLRCRGGSRFMGQPLQRLMFKRACHWGMMQKMTRRKDTEPQKIWVSPTRGVSPSRLYRYPTACPNSQDEGMIVAFPGISYVSDS